MIREIKFYKNYFIEFYLTLDYKDQDKIDYVFNMVRTLHKVPEKFLKHIQDSEGLYEKRISHGRWPLGYFVVLTRVILSSFLMDLLKRKAKHPKLNWILRLN